MIDKNSFLVQIVSSAYVCCKPHVLVCVLSAVDSAKAIGHMIRHLPRFWRIDLRQNSLQSLMTDWVRCEVSSSCAGCEQKEQTVNSKCREAHGEAPGRHKAK